VSQWEVLASSWLSDDLFNLSPFLRLLLQVIVAGCAWWASALTFSAFLLMG